MTTSTEELQRFAATGFAAWARGMTAWTESLTSLWKVAVDWAYDEQVFTGVNQATAYVDPAAKRPMTGRFWPKDDTGTLLTSNEVTVSVVPSSANAEDGTLQVVITLRPGGPDGLGEYRGQIIDADGTVVSGSPISVHVSTTQP